MYLLRSYRRGILHSLTKAESIRYFRTSLGFTERAKLAQACQNTVYSASAGASKLSSFESRSLLRFARQIGTNCRTSTSRDTAGTVAAQYSAEFPVSSTNSINALGLPNWVLSAACSTRAWLSSKAPRGFGNFSPKQRGSGSGGASGGVSNNTKKAASDSSKASALSSKPKPTSSGGGGGGGTPKRKPGLPEEGPDVPSQLSSAVLATMGVALLYLLFGRSEDLGEEISWQEFQSNYLAAGQVEKITVVNKTVAQVTLRPPTQGFARGEVWQADSGSAGPGDFDTTPPRGRDGAMRRDNYPSSGGSGRRSGASLPTSMGAHPRKLYFSIGSVENFERKLEFAQRELGLRSVDYVPVTYTENVNWGSTLLRLSPTLLLIGMWLLMMRGMSGMGGMGGMGGGAGGMGGIFKVGKASPTTKTATGVKFKDVAGCDEAKAEIMEFVQFLKKPEKFIRLGAKVPKGALLVGPPGTGKTLLAKATAGEASVPFFSMSGSDFIEMFVGVGPSRVRDLFKKAREQSPCIIFIDEIDAVARQRSKGGFSGGNDERENTLNQLLVEMDGFSTQEGVVVLAGTNRADILDKAILRPGRFDRQIMVDKPDIKGRRDIFLVYLNKLKVQGDNAEHFAERLAALTPGFAGADISNICNEAAILAARGDKESIDMDDFEGAVDRVIGGLQKKNMLLSPEEKRCVAYHEAGHAIAGWMLEHADPLLKVTIVPHSNGALGYAQYLPKEVALHSTQALKDRICMALGGRASEEIHFGKVTTGASDDLKRVTQMAHAMVSIYGMSDRVGQVSYQQDDNGGFGQAKPYSEQTGQIIDEEVKKIIDDLYQRTKQLLLDNKDKVEAIAEHLLKKETINVDDVIQLIGERPFPMPLTYKEMVAASWKRPIEGNEEDSKEKKKTVDDIEEEGEGGEVGGPVLASRDSSSSSSSGLESLGFTRHN